MKNVKLFFIILINAFYALVFIINLTGIGAMNDSSSKSPYEDLLMLFFVILWFSSFFFAYKKNSILIAFLPLLFIFYPDILATITSILRIIK